MVAIQKGIMLYDKLSDMLCSNAKQEKKHEQGKRVEESGSVAYKNYFRHAGQACEDGKSQRRLEWSEGDSITEEGAS